MKIILIEKYITILYILTILFPCNLSKYMNNNNKKIVNVINQKRYVSEFIKNKKMNNYTININFDIVKDKDIGIKNQPFAPFPQNKTEKEKEDDKYDYEHDKIFDDDDDDDDEEEEEKRRQERDNITNQIRELDDKIDDLNRKITKRRIYVIFLAIITVILFLMVVIYCSIKCYILCTKKHLKNYRISYIKGNNLGEAYIDENGEERINFSMENSNDECEAPIYSSNNGMYGSTFNPDNYKASDQDKNLYKPYNSEEIQ